MKFILVPLALVVIAGVYLLIRLRAGAKGKPVGPGVNRVLIIVKDQEPWVEGFIRKLFCCINRTPWVEVLVLDDCSRDGTAELLGHLQRYYPFKLWPVDVEGTATGAVEADGKFAGALRLDIRALKGKALLCAPLFYQVSQFTQGCRGFCRNNH